MLASVLSTQGSWHAQLAGLPYDAAGQLRDDPKIKAVAVQQEIGYARLPESQNDYKPYWYIQALDDGSAALLGIRLVEGRMPQNAGELLAPEHVLTSGGVAVKAGDTLTLSVGDRLADDGSPLTQTNPYNEAVSYTHLDVYKRQNELSWTRNCTSKFSPACMKNMPDNLPGVQIGRPVF